MLTGKDVYEAARPNIVKHGFEDLEWEDFVPEAQEFYLELAARLNDAHIAPLQGLVREYHAALVDVREGRTLMSDCAFALEKRKKVLLNEEI